MSGRAGQVINRDRSCMDATPPRDHLARHSTQSFEFGRNSDDSIKTVLLVPSTHCDGLEYIESSTFCSFRLLKGLRMGLMSLRRNVRHPALLSGQFQLQGLKVEPHGVLLLFQEPVVPSAAVWDHVYYIIVILGWIFQANFRRVSGSQFSYSPLYCCYLGDRHYAGIGAQECRSR
jgi:hypothetical protein